MRTPPPVREGGGGSEGGEAAVGCGRVRPTEADPTIGETAVDEQEGGPVAPGAAVIFEESVEERGSGQRRPQTDKDAKIEVSFTCEPINPG